MSGELDFLIGTWRGGGDGHWPPTGDFTFEEEMIFEPGGGGDDFPFITYRERAWDPESGMTVHSELGFWLFEDGLVSAVMAHPIAVTEVTEGGLHGSNVDLASKSISRATNGLPVTDYRRRYEIHADEMSHEQQLATEEVPLFKHLSSLLHRES